MSIKELQNAVLVALGSDLVSDGFPSKPIGQSFRRPFSEGKNSLHVSFIPHANDVDFTLDVAVRFDRAEQLISEFEKSQGEIPTKNAFTLGAELGNLIDRQPRRFSVESNADVQPAVASAFEFYMAVGATYLVKYSQPDVALDALAGDAPSAWIHSPFHSARAISAVALAKEYRGLEHALLIAEKKLEFLASVEDGFGAERIKSFAAFLLAKQ